MSLSRYAKRRDETESPIVMGLRKLGYQVRQQDAPDLIVRKQDWPPGMAILMEIDGITKNRKRGLAQLGFLKAWRIPIVKTLDEAVTAAGGKIL